MDERDIRINTYSAAATAFRIKGESDGVDGLRGNEDYVLLLISRAVIWPFVIVRRNALRLYT